MEDNCCDRCQAEDVETTEIWGYNLCEDCQDSEEVAELDDFRFEEDLDYDNKPYYLWEDDEDDDDYGDWDDGDDGEDDDDDEWDGDDSRH